HRRRDHYRGSTAPANDAARSARGVAGLGEGAARSSFFSLDVEKPQRQSIVRGTRQIVLCHLRAEMVFEPATSFALNPLARPPLCDHVDRLATRTPEVERRALFAVPKRHLKGVAALRFNLCPLVDVSHTRHGFFRHGLDTPF